MPGGGDEACVYGVPIPEHLLIVLVGIFWGFVWGVSRRVEEGSRSLLAGLN